MDYYCKLCNKTQKHTSKYKLFKSGNRISSENIIISKYKFLNPDFEEVDEIMRKNVNIYNKISDQYGVRCLLYLLTNTNNIKYIRITTKTNLHHSYYVPEKKILKRINKDDNNFSQILEKRIGFFNSCRFMSYKYYLK